MRLSLDAVGDGKVRLAERKMMAAMQELQASSLAPITPQWNVSFHGCGHSLLLVDGEREVDFVSPWLQAELINAHAHRHCYNEGKRPGEVAEHSYLETLDMPLKDVISLLDGQKLGIVRRLVSATESFRERVAQRMLRSELLVDLTYEPLAAAVDDKKKVSEQLAMMGFQQYSVYWGTLPIILSIGTGNSILMNVAGLERWPSVDDSNSGGSASASISGSGSGGMNLDAGSDDDGGGDDDVYMRVIGVGPVCYKPSSIGDLLARAKELSSTAEAPVQVTVLPNPLCSFHDDAVLVRDPGAAPVLNLPAAVWSVAEEIFDPPVEMGDSELEMAVGGSSSSTKRPNEDDSYLDVLASAAEACGPTQKRQRGPGGVSDDEEEEELIFPPADPDEGPLQRTLSVESDTLDDETRQRAGDEIVKLSILPGEDNNKKADALMIALRSQSKSKVLHLLSESPNSAAHPPGSY